MLVIENTNLQQINDSIQKSMVYNKQQSLNDAKQA